MTTTSRKQLWNACLGNLFEHYDTALFGFLSPFLAPLIFPKQDPLVALILTYALIPIGMVVRPLGSLVFGLIGDIYGRRQALFLSLAGMSLVSDSIAFTPTYLQIGLLTPCRCKKGWAIRVLSSDRTLIAHPFLHRQGVTKFSSRR